jgi:DUF4097 and DUF4098 domain-containing protein YvlB
MPQSAGPTPVRLEIRAGEIAVCGSRLVRIEATTTDGRVRVEISPVVNIARSLLPI